MIEEIDLDVRFKYYDNKTNTYQKRVELAKALHAANIGDLTEILAIHKKLKEAGDIESSPAQLKYIRGIVAAICIVTERFNKQGG